ncbi:MAG: hypothetical protein DI556_06930 [Rhodovulum sulfidophilum]|uniref:Protein BatD n=1 Tax=Rhodovulum sulfidophilum TaxID=35806 RepID=A0A2W5QH69_RHOSU|nr:MAG: hypothetical protein DI556_06930 [Rhodovulum sulfidophilum]
MARRLTALAALLCALPAVAQETPRVSVTRDPDGPVTVGTPVTITATVLVPTWMPSPPVWPDLEIADAVTRLPDRATHPLSQRVGEEMWSGLSRSWEIIPQRAADYDLGPAEIALTYADPATSQPVEASVALTDLGFTASLPPGAEGMDPFLAASALSLAATATGLPEAPKPGDAVTLTLTTTAVGPPSILLPPLAARIATPAGLRAYPKQPVLTDTAGERGAPPTATRTEAVTYVIEQPGDYAIPAPALDWWSTATNARETATAEGLAFEAAAPPGWHTESGGGPDRRLLLGAIVAGAAALLIGVLVWRGRDRAPKPPSERRLYHRLRRAARSGAPGTLRGLTLAWLARARPEDPAPTPAIEAALRRLERAAYGAAPEAPGRDDRRALRAALAAGRAEFRAAAVAARAPRLPPLNPPVS